MGYSHHTKLRDRELYSDKLPIPDRCESVMNSKICVLRVHLLSTSGIDVPVSKCKLKTLNGVNAKSLLQLKPNTHFCVMDSFTVLEWPDK